MEDDSTNFVKYFTDKDVLEKPGVGEYQPKAEES